MVRAREVAADCVLECHLQSILRLRVLQVPAGPLPVLPVHRLLAVHELHILLMAHLEIDRSVPVAQQLSLIAEVLPSEFQGARYLDLGFEMRIIDFLTGCNPGNRKEESGTTRRHMRHIWLRIAGDPKFKRVNRFR